MNPGVTVQEARNIIKRNCGDPPDPKKLEYHIWLNKKKLSFYTDNPFYRGPKHSIHLKGFEILIKEAQILLDKNPSEVPDSIPEKS